MTLTLFTAPRVAPTDEQCEALVRLGVSQVIVLGDAPTADNEDWRTNGSVQVLAHHLATEAPWPLLWDGEASAVLTVTEAISTLEER